MAFNLSTAFNDSVTACLRLRSSCIQSITYFSHLYPRDLAVLLPPLTVIIMLSRLLGGKLLLHRCTTEPYMCRMSLNLGDIAYASSALLPAIISKHTGARLRSRQVTTTCSVHPLTCSSPRLRTFIPLINQNSKLSSAPASSTCRLPHV